MNKTYLTWENIEDDCLILSKKIPSNIKTLIPITRGGLFIAGFLSQILNIRDIRNICATTYNEDKKINAVEILHIPRIFHNKQPDCIIVDDVLDSGTTLETIYKIGNINNVHGHAVLYQKEKHHKKLNTDMVVETYDNDEWIVFPWEPIDD